MTVLDDAEWEAFQEKIQEGLKHPTPLVYPKILTKEILRKIQDVARSNQTKN
jgi:hypothetical protein